MLHGDEQRRLAEIEQHLHETDPAFADRLRRFQPDHRTAPATAGSMLGLALFVIGAATGWWILSVVGAATFALSIVAVRRARRTN
jgi:hypothetical protein